MINQVGQIRWLPDQFSEDEKLEQMKPAIVMLAGLKPQGEIEYG